MAINKKGEEVSAMRLGDVIKVWNQKRKFGANHEYYSVRLQTEDGKEINALFTAHQMKVAIERAQKNPEDIPEVSWIRDIFD